MGSFIRSFMVL